MVADHVAKQSSKRKRMTKDSAGDSKAKKYKEFKF